MQKSFWRKRFAILKNRLYLYPAPDAMSHDRWFWFAMGLVTILAAAFSIYFILYLTGLQDALHTPAEDMGIMDQVLWSLVHGQGLHQTICNPVSDTNCYGLAGIPRFAIHFEPILFPTALFYWLWPGPKILMVLQTVVVAAGAFPAFWLARLRLRSTWAGVIVAALYLLYPELQQAEVGFFHAVTMTAALLLFLLYFMYTRRTGMVFLFAILSMACKEEIPLVVAMFGLWSIVFQQRWRTGTGLIVLALAWLGMSELIFHLFSPVGHPLLSSRYADLGSGPVEILRNIVLHPVNIIKEHVLEANHRRYLQLLLAPVSYLPLLAPWVLVLALPSLAINLLSSDPAMYSGVAQYNAELVPILIFSTIESLVLIVRVAQALWKLVQPMYSRIEEARERRVVKMGGGSERSGGVVRWLQPVLLFLLLFFVLFGIARRDQWYGMLPYSAGVHWPEVSEHDLLAQHFFDLIPSSASVSAQSSLVPHLSRRSSIYLYPYGVGVADYILLDVTSDQYPFSSQDYTAASKDLLLKNSYGIVAAQDGYILLKRGLPAPGLSPVSVTTSGADALPELPTSFCTFAQPGSLAQNTTSVQVDFGGAVDGDAVNLVGFHINGSGQHYELLTYWRVNQNSALPALTIKTSLVDKSGREVFQNERFIEQPWCPTQTWQAGTIIRMSTQVLYLGGTLRGQVGATLALLPYRAASTTIESSKGLPFHVVHAPHEIAPLAGKNVLQLQTFTVTG